MKHPNLPVASALRNRPPVALALGALLWLASLGGAHAAGVTFAGTESSSSSRYTYLGLVQPVAGGRLGSGWYVRGVVSYLSYDYSARINGVNRTVQAQAPGLEVGVGHALPLAPGWTLDASLSGGARRTDLTPDDPGNDARGTHAMVTPQLGLRGRLGRLELDMLGAHAYGVNSDYARARLGVVLQPGLKTGVEAALREGERYRDRRYGVYLGMELRPRGNLTFSVGRTTDREGRSANYFSIGGGGSF